jgi:hypothetical protein
MPAAAVVTLIGVALTVAVLAAYLLRVAWSLHHVANRLGDVVGVLREIGRRTEPLGPVTEQIHGDLATVTAAMDRLLESKLERTQGDASRGG